VFWIGEGRAGPGTEGGVADDGALASALATDLAGTFDRVVLAFQDRLYRFALRLTGSAADAEEIAQDAFVRAYRALEGYPPGRRRALALRPWLYRIALNVARNRFRRPRLLTTPLDGAAAERLADPGRPPGAALERDERERALAGHVAALPERYRAAVVLRHVEGLGYAEIGAILGQPVGTAKANVHRGVAALRVALAAPAGARARPPAAGRTARPASIPGRRLAAAAPEPTAAADRARRVTPEEEITA
jgi:RNA polymerase sigma-70 factor (ECF subfamily)